MSEETQYHAYSAFITALVELKVNLHKVKTRNVKLRLLLQHFITEGGLNVRLLLDNPKAQQACLLAFTYLKTSSDPLDQTVMSGFCLALYASGDQW